MLLAGCATQSPGPAGMPPRSREAALERFVLVGVFDDVTRLPVAGVRITASYFTSGPPPKITVGDEAVTDERGLALVRGIYQGETKPFFTAKIDSAAYKFEGATYPGLATDRRIAARASQEKPTEFDVSFAISSKATAEKRDREWQANRAAASAEAERQFRSEPEYWPPQGDGPFPYAKGDSASELIGMRWSSASRASLGTPADDTAIKATVIRHLKHLKSEVNEVRWINSSTVMVSAGWYDGPLSSAGFTYVLKKRGDRWQVLTYYMNFIS